MTLREKLQKAWDNRGAIAEGFYNEYISNDQEIKQETERRREICKKCEYYDPAGKVEIVVVKGEPGCMLCGCNISLLTAAMSMGCSVPKIGLKARWEPLISKEQEMDINTVAYQQQFKNKKPE